MEYNIVIKENGEEYQTLKDILPETGPLNILFIGKTPSPVSVEKGHYFQGVQGRMFWNRLVKYGLMEEPPKDDFHDNYLLKYNYGITVVVKKPHASGKEPTDEEYQCGFERLAEIIDKHSPKIIVFVYKKILDNILRTVGINNKAVYGFNPELEHIFNAKVFVFPVPGTPCNKEEGDRAMAELCSVLGKSYLLPTSIRNDVNVSPYKGKSYTTESPVEPYDEEDADQYRMIKYVCIIIVAIIFFIMLIIKCSPDRNRNDRSDFQETIPADVATPQYNPVAEEQEEKTESQEVVPQNIQAEKVNDNKIGMWYDKAGGAFYKLYKEGGTIYLNYSDLITISCKYIKISSKNNPILRNDSGTFHLNKGTYVYMGLGFEECFDERGRKYSSNIILIEQGNALHVYSNDYEKGCYDQLCIAYSN